MMDLFLLQSTLAEFLRPRRIVVWVFVAAGVSLLAYAWTALAGNMKPSQAYAQMSLVLVYRLLPLVAAIFSAAVISQEIAQKTIVYLVTRPVHRSALVFFRSLAAAIAVFLVVALCATAVAFVIFGPGAIQQSTLVRDWGVLALGSSAYVSLFVLISLWVNRAMVVFLLYAFAWETLVPNMPGDLYYLSIYSHLTALASKPAGSTEMPLLNALSGQLSVNVLTARTALPVLVAISVVCAGLAAWWFARFEYVPREDTD